MTRTHLAQKVTGFKTLAVRTLAVAALAGAALAVAPAAQAQRVYFGFGGPRVVVAAPPVAVYGGPAYYYGHDRDDWRAREEFREREYREQQFREQQFREQQEWREHHDHDGWRDHDDHRGYDRR